MNSEIKVREHQWCEMKVTPVTLVPDDEGNPIAISSGKESRVTVGCFACNMGMDEGFGIECPGQDLFEEDPEGGGS
jgi:hypothetical protein